MAATAIAGELGAEWYVVGAALEQGDLIWMNTELYQTGEHNRPLVRAQAGGTSDQLPTVVNDLTHQLLVGRRMSERIDLARLTTHSVPALKDFLAGETAMRQGDFAQAVAYFGEAVRKDSTFALAYIYLSWSNVWIGRLDVARTALNAGFRHADRLTTRDRTLAHGKQAYLDGDVGGVERELVPLLGSYSHDIDAWSMLGDAYFHMNLMRGRSAQEARGPYERVLDRMPNHPEAIVHFVGLATMADSSSEFERLTERLRELGVSAERLTSILLRRAVVWGSTTEVDSLLRGRDWEDVVLASAARTGAVVRRGRSVDRARLAALALAEGERPTSSRAAGHIMLGKMAWMRGRSDDAVQELRTAIRLSAGLGLVARASLAIAPLAHTADDDLRELYSDLHRWTPSGVIGGNVHPVLGTSSDDLPVIRAYLLGVIAARLQQRVAALEHAAALDRMIPPTGAPALTSHLARGVRVEVALADDDRAASPSWSRWNPASTRSQ